MELVSGTVGEVKTQPFDRIFAKPILLVSIGMFEHFRRYPWVLESFFYDDQGSLLVALNDKVIGPAERKANEQMR